jgi:5-(carboxyamino)imidazole ribonucleotide mutase
MPKVAILMGSQNDMSIMQKAVDVFNEQGIECSVYVASAHRTPEKVHAIAQDIEKNYDIVISAAGMAAHLGGVLASLTIKPVIGVPISTSPLNGMDSLLSTVQMPPGIPVATVAIDGAKNAAILAMQIMALYHPDIAQKVKNIRESFKN